MKNRSHYVTVCKTSYPSNKTYWVKDGNLEKESSSAHSIITAHVVFVPDENEFAELLVDVRDQENCFIILGYPPDKIDAGEFTIVSEKKFNELSDKDKADVVIRNLKSFQQSSWALLDYDIEPETPKKLKLSRKNWLNKITSAAPLLKGVKRVVLASSSSCVLVNGKQYKKYCLHTYIQVKNPDDVSRFGKALFYTLVNSGLVYQITIKSGHKVDRSIIDASVFQSNRITYEGRPKLVGDSLELKDYKIKAYSGKRVDTEKLKMPELKEGLKYNSKTGTVESEDLLPDIPIETEHGIMTPAEYLKSEYYPNKVRCQTPFRPDSDTQNGILHAHKRTGTVFVYDNGTGRKYTLKRKVSTGTATNMFEVFEDMTVTNELVKEFEDTKPLYKDVMAKGHIVGWIGKPGSGKTTLMKSFIEDIAKEYSVAYVMMDVGPDEIKPHQEHADRFNYKLIWPNGTNMSNKDVLEKIKAMGRSNMDLHKSVLVIDSTKKLVNVNQKDLAVEFLEVLRTANAKGLSIELLMHTTKYRDAEGHLIHAGTQDFIDDIDETNYVEFTRPDDATQRIAVYPDKKRNTFVKPTSYIFKNKDRSVTRDKKFTDLKKANDAGKKIRPNDNDHIFSIIDVIQNGTIVKGKIVSLVGVNNPEHSAKHTRELLDALSDENYTGYCLIEEEGCANNSTQYTLKDDFDLKTYKKLLSFKTK